MHIAIRIMHYAMAANAHLWRIASHIAWHAVCCCQGMKGKVDNPMPMLDLLLAAIAAPKHTREVYISLAVMRALRKARVQYGKTEAKGNV